MKKIIGLWALTILFTGCYSFKQPGAINKMGQASGSDFYNLKAVSMQGQEISMSDYNGKVVLVVNTASKCGYTPQFEDLEELYRKLNTDGFVVLGFPSNQFGNQDPGSNEEILAFCQANYGVTFPMFEKIDVNGENEHPIYKYLKKNVPQADTSDIKWNFTKFLIGKDGNVLKRYESKIKPAEIEIDILSALKDSV